MTVVGDRPSDPGGDGVPDVATDAGDRGQVYTLEGIIAALVVMAGLLFALQATTATPQAAGIANPQAEQQDRAVVQGLLAVADDETLREAALFWDPDDDEFHCTPAGSTYYPAPNTSQTSDVAGATECPHSDDARAAWIPPNDFGRLLDTHLGSGYSFNVYVSYHDGDEFREERMVYQGQAGDGVVRGAASVAVMDGDRLYEANETRTSTTVGGGTDFYAPDDTSEDLYNVLYVEVEVWRG